VGGGGEGPKNDRAGVTDPGAEAVDEPAEADEGQAVSELEDGVGGAVFGVGPVSSLSRVSLIRARIWRST